MGNGSVAFAPDGLEAANSGDRVQDIGFPFALGVWVVAQFPVNSDRSDAILGKRFLLSEITYAVSGETGGVSRQTNLKEEGSARSAVNEAKNPLERAV